MKQKEKKKRITRRGPKCSFHFLLHLHQHRNKNNSVAVNGNSPPGLMRKRDVPAN